MRRKGFSLAENHVFVLIWLFYLYLRTVNTPSAFIVTYLPSNAYAARNIEARVEDWLRTLGAGGRNYNFFYVLIVISSVYLIFTVYYVGG